MSWMQRLTSDGGVVSVEVTRLGAWVEISKEMEVSYGAAGAAMDGLKAYAVGWIDEGWVFVTEPVFRRDEDFLRNTAKITLEVQAWRRPGVWTDVDTAVNLDTDGEWAREIA